MTNVTLLDFELNIVGTWAIPDSRPPMELRRPAWHMRRPFDQDALMPPYTEEVYEYVGFNTYRRRR